MNQHKEMSFIDHLEELRWHIIRSLLAVLVITVVAFFLKGFIFDTLIFAPTKAHFLTYRAFCWLSRAIPFAGALCMQPANFVLINTEMSGQFMMHLQVAIVLGFVCSFPYIFWEMWRFIEPGLMEEERKYTKGVVFVASLLFFAGVLFGYYLVTPFSINFLAGYYVSASVANTIAITSYVETLTSIVLAAGLMFELPLIVFFVAKMGLVRAEDMRQYRRHAIVVILFVAAIITPPDVMSQILVTLPVLALYEASIWVAAVVAPKDDEINREVAHKNDEINQVVAPTTQN